MDTIELIKIKGFKSIASLELHNIQNFSTIAGPNGAGKSNLVDALAFFGAVISRGAIQAIRDFGGYQHIHCFKLNEIEQTSCSFEIKIKLQTDHIHYLLQINQLDGKPHLIEQMYENSEPVIERTESTMTVLYKRGDNDSFLQSISDFPTETSLMAFKASSPLRQFLNNIRVFRIDPNLAKEPDASHYDDSELDHHGRNIASMLSKLEQDNNFREQILDWLELIVPGIEQIHTTTQELDNSTMLTFKEEGHDKQFPAHLISDGTVYALCIMTAVISRSNQLGITIIEEPERGIHPKAIGELVELMRDNALIDHPVFITTHSESVVRANKPQELLLINKHNGITQVTPATNANLSLGDMPLDKAWLGNLFNGGLPW